MGAPPPITLEVILTWPIPNYDNPVTQTTALEALLYSLTILMILFVIARIYVRGNQNSGMGLDDWVIIVAAVLAVANTVVLLVLCRYAIGRHIYDVRPVWIICFAKMNLASISLKNVSISLAKISVCMTYLRLFPSRANKIFSWTMITYQSIWGIVTSTLYVVQCVPLHALWDPTIKNRTCLDQHKLLNASFALGILSDFLIFLWPVMPLWNVKLLKSQRIHLVIVFSFGVFTCVGGLLKLIWAQNYFKTWDVTWVSAKANIGVCLELNIGIMSGCLPCLRPFLALLFPKYFSASSVKHSNYPSSNRGESPWLWRTPFSKRSANSTNHLSQECFDFVETYEFAERRHTGTKVESVQNDVVLPGKGIWVLKDVKVQHGRPPSKATHDANSEEWIMHDRA